LSLFIFVIVAKILNNAHGHTYFFLSGNELSQRMFLKEIINFNKIQLSIEFPSMWLRDLKLGISSLLGFYETSNNNFVAEA